MVNRDYFKDQVSWDGLFDYPPQFQTMAALAGFEAAPGVTLRPFWGKNLMASYVTFSRGAAAPRHQHPQEQMSLVLSGALLFTVGDVTQWIRAGDVVSIPANVPHAATASEEGAVAVDMFSPPRDGFHELMGAVGTEGS